MSEARLAARYWGAVAASFAIVIALGTVTPSTARAQETRTDTASVDEARLTAYAKAFVAISLIRDSISAELARPRNKTNEAQHELREKLRDEIAKALREQSLTQEDYNRITYVISTDGARRKTFDELLSRLMPKATPR